MPTILSEIEDFLADPQRYGFMPEHIRAYLRYTVRLAEAAQTLVHESFIPADRIDELRRILEEAVDETE